MYEFRNIKKQAGPKASRSGAFLQDNRSAPTAVQMKSMVPVNDNKGQEKEADLMGTKALQKKEASGSTSGLLIKTHSSGTSQLKQKPDPSKKTLLDISVGNTQNTAEQNNATDLRQKVIQRDVVVGLNALMPPTINAVTVTRLGMASFFWHTWGDHTTPFVLFRALFRNRLTGLTLNAAVAVLNNIHGEILALPGFVNLAAAPPWAQVIANTENANVNAMSIIANGAVGGVGGPVTIAMINNYASALLSLRNVIPLSAVEFGGVGHGEGHWQGQMQGLENELAVGNPFNGARQGRLNRYAKKLIDRDAFGEFNQGVITPVDKDIAPGLTGNLHTNSVRMANQHVQSIESAYPSIRLALAGNPGARINLVNYLIARL